MGKVGKVGGPRKRKLPSVSDREKRPNWLISGGKGQFRMRKGAQDDVLKGKKGGS